MEKEEIRRKLKKLIRKLEKIRGRHTELVSVYIPAGSNLVDIINQLREELSTAENIKSKTTRKNVTGALEKILQYLKLFRKTPPNGLVIFCGNVSPIEGKTEMKLWSIEPPEPLDTKIYWCDQVFVLEPLKEMVAEKDIYGLIVLDTREADIGILKGKKVRLLKKIESMVPSKTIKGGMCVAEDSLIQLEDGKIIQIKELSNNSKILVYSFKKFKPLFSNSFELYKRRAKIAYKILLEEPSNSIVLTPEHLVFVVGKNGIEEKYVEEIKKGDFLLMLRNFRINSGLKITKDLAQLLGYILGDGTLDNNRIILYDKDPDLIKRYKKIVKRL
ncbi:MAG: peptide chain release factor aRF-1, partial [Candidatus Aenigmarchaeota archaeon]|nr:peptide chain release factor aRF-1 [Candidatus Aenigmarchaeota archaeon]